MITTVKDIINSLILLIILLTFILINILLKQSINDKFFDIAIYKSIGYKDKYIFQLLFYELFLITTLSYLFSIVPSFIGCLLYTSPSPRDGLLSRMPSSA